MAAGLYSGTSSLAIGTGLYKGVSGLWGGASGLINGFGGTSWLPTALFAAGEQGAWYDPSDLTTMWQDYQGVTPVTAPSQSVGLILDKHIGTRTQVFDDANVTFTGTAGYAGRISPGVYEYARDASGNGIVNFGGLTAGKTYLVSVQISVYTGAIPGITGNRADYASALNVATRPLTSTAGTYTFFYLADGSTFAIRAGGPPNGGTISNVSILEVPGNHATQATAAARPILRQDGALYYLEFDGIDDSLATAAIDFSASDEMSMFAGVRKLSTSTGAIAELGDTSALSGSIIIYSIVDRYATNSRGTTQLILNGTNSSTPPSTNVVSSLADISSPSLVLRVDGSVDASSTGSQGTGNYGNRPFYIGRRLSTTLPFNGRIYSLIVRGALTSGDLLTSAETYVAGETGVTI